MRVAIVHYWMVSYRGGERVVEELCTLFPQAHIYTHVVDPAVLSPELSKREIRTTFINRLPFARKLYRHYVPLMPRALEELDLRNYDLVISSESGPAKGVITGTRTLHICYCHSPMRYLWGMYHEYRENASWLTRTAMSPLFHRMRLWDLASAARVDHFVANSTEVGRRIRKIYRREADVIHPPVSTSDFAPAAEPGDFYLYCGQLVPYKRADLAVEAFNRMRKPLVVIGGGDELAKIRKMAGPTVTVLGAQPFPVLRHHYSRCRALIFPGEEDFGIVPVEAMASGRPVIAYGAGGVLDTVIDGKTGILFPEQTVDAIIRAVGEFEAAQDRFRPEALVAHARRFDRERFRDSMSRLIEKMLAATDGSPAPRTSGAMSQRELRPAHESFSPAIK